MRICIFHVRLAEVCPPGEVYDACAYKCSMMCENVVALYDQCDKKDACIPMCKPEGFTCPAGEKLRDRANCVPDAMCPCRKQDGTIAKVNTSSTIVFKRIKFL